MDKKINVLLLCGGGGGEHDISLVSADFFEDVLSQIPEVRTLRVSIDAKGRYHGADGEPCELSGDRLSSGDRTITVHYALACLHGYPGETGHVQSLFEMAGIPYFGASSEASRLCFNKISTKLWAGALGIPHTPYRIVSSEADMPAARQFLEERGRLFVKPACQGSSLGCAPVETKEGLDAACEQALRLSLSPYALVEQCIEGRELEVAVFTYGGRDEAAAGEILCPGGFYCYEKKYDPATTAKTETHADLDPSVRQALSTYAKRAFTVLGIKDLARVDFFLTSDGSIFLNEINTMPGHTPISLFPSMLKAHGVEYKDFLSEKISGGHL